MSPGFVGPLPTNKLPAGWSLPVAFPLVPLLNRRRIKFLPPARRSKQSVTEAKNARGGRERERERERRAAATRARQGLATPLLLRLFLFLPSSSLSVKSAARFAPYFPPFNNHATVLGVDQETRLWPPVALGLGHRQTCCARAAGRRGIRVKQGRPIHFFFISLPPPQKTTFSHNTHAIPTTH